MGELVATVMLRVLGSPAVCTEVQRLIALDGMAPRDALAAAGVVAPS